MLRRDSGRILFEQSYSGTLFIIRGLLNYYLSFLLCLSIVSLHWSLLYHQSPPHRRHTVDWEWAKMIYLVWAFWGMSHLVLEAVQQALKSFQMSSADEALVFIAFISLLLSPFQSQKKKKIRLMGQQFTDLISSWGPISPLHSHAAPFGCGSVFINCLC